MSQNKRNPELRSDTDKLFSNISHPVMKIAVNVYVVGRGHNKGNFYAAYKEKYFNNPLYSELHKDVMSHLESLEGVLEWLPILTVKVRRKQEDDSGWRDGQAELSIQPNRFYVALNQRKKWLKVSWTIPEAQRRDKCEQLTPNGRNDNRRGYSELAQVDFSVLPQTIRDRNEDNNQTYILPYTEQMYSAIRWLGKEVVKLGDVLDKMLGSDEGKAAILDRSMKLLSDESL